jgi:hypothetical protein
MFDWTICVIQHGPQKFGYFSMEVLYESVSCLQTSEKMMAYWHGRLLGCILHLRLAFVVPVLEVGLPVPQLHFSCIKIYARLTCCCSGSGTGNDWMRYSICFAFTIRS